MGTAQDYPMDSMQVGKAVFVKESYTTLGIEPRTYSNPGRSGNHLVYSWVKCVLQLMKMILHLNPDDFI